MTGDVECLVAGSTVYFAAGSTECVVAGVAEYFVDDVAECFVGAFLAGPSVYCHPNPPWAPHHSCR